MSNIKPSDHGIVVEHKESGLRYASLDANFDPANERKVRDLKPGESVFSYAPKTKEASKGSEDASEGRSATSPQETQEKSESGRSEPLTGTQGKATTAEGAASAATQGKKEGN